MRSILKKAFMALTGLGLLGFLITHLLGNLQLFGGPAGFNHYAKSLEDLGPLLYVAEIGLLVLFVAHIILAIKVTGENNAARPIGYQAKKTAGESTLASRTMMFTGLIILVFVILHIINFKFGEKYQGTGAQRTLVLWELVVKVFSHPLYAAWYVVAMLVLGLHLSHGTSSLLQTLGVIKPDWRTKSRKIGAVIGWIIALGFASMPIYVYLAHPNPVDPVQIKLSTIKPAAVGTPAADADARPDR